MELHDQAEAVAEIVAVIVRGILRASVLRLFGLSSTAKRTALGSSSCKSPSRLVPSSAYRVCPDTKNDRNCRGGGFGRECGWCAGRRGDHGHSTLHQIAHQFRQPSVIVVCETEFDRHTAAFDEACFVQAFAERGHNTCA